MSCLGLDLDATRVVALAGSPGSAPHALPLDRDGGSLPMAVAIDGRSSLVGRAALSQAKIAPHETCVDFLSWLGERKEWGTSKRLKACDALFEIGDTIRRHAPAAESIAVVVPPYLNRTQADLLVETLQRARLPIHTTITTPLAAASAAFHQRLIDEGTFAVASIDEHAFSWTHAASLADQANIITEKHLPNLGLRVWRDRLINVLSDRCVRQSRRDPRDSGQAEQMLFDQLDGLCQAVLDHRPVEVTAQSRQWFQNFVVRPEETQHACAPLVNLALEALKPLLAGDSPPALLVLTQSAGLLPGLVPALHEVVGTLSVLPGEALAKTAFRWSAIANHRIHADVAIPYQPTPSASPKAQQNPASWKRVFSILRTDR